MYGYHENKEDYRRRLARIEGQVRGIQRMVDDDKYCIDILHQVSAVTRALQGVAMGLLDEHVRHCVRDAIYDDDPSAGDAKISEALDAVERLVKS